MAPCADFLKYMTSLNRTTSVHFNSWIMLHETSCTSSGISVLLSASQTNTGSYLYYLLSFDISREVYSFLFRRSTTLYNRRQAKILTTVTSLFTSSYVYNWSNYLPDKELKYPPSFDGRIVMYPAPKEVRDYFSWRQADSEEQCYSRSPRAID